MITQKEDLVMLLAQQLHVYLMRTGQTREDLAAAMGVNGSLLSRLIPSDGSPPIREPRLSTIKRLVAASGGAITLEDFCRDGAFLEKGSPERRRRKVIRDLPSLFASGSNK